MILVQNDSVAARRRVPLFLVDAVDMKTPRTGEAGGQPQISKNGAAWTNSSAVLVAIGQGGYYLELTLAEIDTPGKIFYRYKSGNTCEFQDYADVLALDVFTPKVQIATGGIVADSLATDAIGAAALSSAALAAIADALLDRTDAVEAGLTFRKALRLLTTVAGGKTMGVGTDAVEIRNVVDTKTRLTAVMDDDGNRVTVTTDLT